MKTSKLNRVLTIFLAVLLVLGGALTNPAMTQADEDDAKVELKATKTLEGGTLEADQFEFTIKAETEGAPAPEKSTAKNDAEGNISFGTADFSNCDEGDYVYVVKEVKGSDSTITYDESEQKITVTVKKESVASGVGGHPNAENGKSDVEQQIVSLSVGQKINPGQEGEETEVKVKYIHGDRLGPVNGYASYKAIEEGDDQYHPFCMVYWLDAEGSDDESAQGLESRTHRLRYNGVGANGSGGDWLGTVLRYYQGRDGIAYEHTRIDAKDAMAPDRDAYGKGLAKLLYYGYPHNAAGLMEEYKLTEKEFYLITQEALFAFSRYGGKIENGADTQGDFRTASGNTEVFDKLYEGCTKDPDTTGMWDPWDETNGPWVTLYVHYSNEGTQPLLSSYLKVDSEEKTTATATTTEFTNKKTSGSTENNEQPKGGLKTTAKVGSQKGQDGAPVKLEESDVSSPVTVEDTIDYEGLTPGATYKVQGTLMEVSGSSVTEVAKSEETECVASDTGSGSWTIKFENVTLKTDTKYVVYEEAVNKDDANDKAEHKDKDDDSQTIIVGVPNTSGGNVKIAVEKKWDDKNNAEGKRPDSVTVYLIKNGDTDKPEAEITLNADNDWTGTFDVESEDGVTWSVSEKAVDYYVKRVVGDESSGFTITNYSRPWVPRIPGTPGDETATFSVQKTVSGGAEADKAFPITVKFTLPDGTSYTETVALKSTDPGAFYPFVVEGTKVEISENVDGYKATIKIDDKEATSFTAEKNGYHVVIVNNEKISTPSSTTVGSNPNTGDTTNILPWIVMLVAAIALAGALVIRKKRSNNQ